MQKNRRPPRPDHVGPQRREYNKNKKIILKTQRICAICGQPVDFSKKYPDPESPTIDHIRPISKGGDPSDIKNLRLTHWRCNRAKGAKCYSVLPAKAEIQKNNKRKIQLSRDWNRSDGE